MATTVKTVKTSGGDYTALDTALDTEAADLTGITTDVTFDGVNIAMHIECYNFQDGTRVTSSGWVTDSTHFLLVEAVNDHGSAWSTSAYRLVSNLNWGYSCEINVGYLLVAGLQIENGNSPENGANGFQMNLGAVDDDQRLIALIVRNTSGVAVSTTNSTGIHMGGGQAAMSEIRNSVVLHFGRGINTANWHGSKKGRFYNNIVDDCLNGIILGSLGNTGTSMKNNIVQNTVSGGTAYTDVVGGNAANISDDASSPNSAFRNKTVSFVGSGDYALASGDTEAAENGVDLSGDSLWAFDDDGTAVLVSIRPESTNWDIGAFERVAAVGVTVLRRRREES